MDGVSFSHLESADDNAGYGSKNKYDEDYDMGAYGDHAAYKEPKKTQSSLSYNDEGDPVNNYGRPKQESKADPFGWDTSKPASSKFESYSKPKPVEDRFEDTGYDGWNDVKRSGTTINKNIPDPYSKSQTTKISAYDPYPDNRYNSDFNQPQDNQRMKSTTVVQKQKDFFEANYNQSSNNKNFDFDKSNQPKEFDFNSFPNKSTKKAEDFDNIFEKTKSTQLQNQNDPFSWGNDNKNTKSNSEFDFDFNSEKEKQTQKVEKKNADILFDAPMSTSPQKPKFDPFADNSGGIVVNSNDLSGIKFDPPPQPVPVVKPQTFEFEPVIKTEVKVVEKKLEPDELLSQKTLFNLSNLSKNKPAKVEIKSDSFNIKFGQSNSTASETGFSTTLGSNFGTSFGDSSFPSSFSAPAKPPESKAERLNALESCFGTTDVKPVPIPTAAFEMNTVPQKPKGNDFGEFPTMFGSTPGGFGTFQGFGNEGFGSSAAKDFAFKSEEKITPAPVQKKKDDWFEF